MTQNKPKVGPLFFGKGGEYSQEKMNETAFICTDNQECPFSQINLIHQISSCIDLSSLFSLFFFQIMFHMSMVNEQKDSSCMPILHHISIIDKSQAPCNPS